METVFLVCFAFGALFTIISVALGAIGGFGGHAGGHAGDLGHGIHVGHAGHAAHVGDLSHAAHAGHVGDAGHAAQVDAGHGDVQGAHGAAARSPLPLLNLSSLLAFLTWFGAAGYVLLRFAGLPIIVVAALAIVAGCGGAVIIAAFLRKVLAGERVMDPRDYQLEGTIARVTISIPAKGAGEILFSKAGTRRSEAARSLDGRPIARETEVVVVGYERGIAAVQPWQEFVRRDRPERRDAPQDATPLHGGS